MNDSTPLLLQQVVARNSTRIHTGTSSKADNFLMTSCITRVQSPPYFKRDVLVSSRLFARQQQRRSVFDKAGGILYRTSVFNATELETISSEVKTHLKYLQEETSSSIAQNPATSPLV